MHSSVDYQIELNLKKLEDELQNAEQQYLERVQSIVAKYTNRASSLREESLKAFEEEFNVHRPKTTSINQNKETQTPIKPKRNPVTQRSKSCKSPLTLLKRTTTDEPEDIEIDSPIQNSGYTPTHVQRIRESLTRGKLMYHLKQSKKSKQSRDREPSEHSNDSHRPKSSAIPNLIPSKSKDNVHSKPSTTSRPSHRDQDVHKSHGLSLASLIRGNGPTLGRNPNTKNTTKPEDDSVLLKGSHSEDDDDLSIPLNSWSRKLCDRNTIDTIDSLGVGQSFQSNHSMVSSSTTDGVRIHHEDISDLSSIGSLRNSYVLSNTLKYGQPQSKFKRQLMVNRLRRKRKYQCLESQPHDIGAVGDGVHRMDGVGTDKSVRFEEPPMKRSNMKSVDVMSSRDLKQELKRINKAKVQTSFNRRNMLLRKSMPNVLGRDKVSPRKDRAKKGKNAVTMSYDTRRIRNVLKGIFNSPSSDDDDDLK